MAYARVTQAVAYVLANEGIPARVTQAVVYVLANDGTSGGGGTGTDGETCPESTLFGGLKRQVLTMLGEDPDAPVYWSSAEIGRHINDAYSDVCLDTKALEMIEGVQLTEDDGVARLSDQVGSVFRVTWNDRKIENITSTELDRIEYNWEGRSGLITHYVTSRQNDHTIRTFQRWDGTLYNAWNLFFSDAYTYTDWLLGNTYVVNDRVTKDLADATGNTGGYVCILAHTASATTEPGVGATWTTYWVPIGLMVWAVRNPPKLVDDGDEPLLPPWSHIGIAYDAAARALRKHGEQQNMEAAKVYDGMAQQYWKLLKGIVANRTPEMISIVGSRRVPRRKPMPWDNIVVG